MKSKMTRTILAACILLNFLSVSCRKNDKPVDPVPTPVIGSLSKIEYKNGEYDSLFYNSDGAISKVKSHIVIPSPYDEVFVFEYDANKKITRITDNIGEHYDYKYINGQLAAVNHYAAGVKNDYRFYDYQNGKLVGVEEYYNISSGTPAYAFMGKREISYYPDGNIKEEVNYSVDTQTHLPKKNYTLEHTDYDNKFNPIDEASRFLYLSQVQMAKNNARKVTRKDELNGTVTEYNIEYTYNNFSNPLSSKISYMSGGQLYTDLVKYHYY
jgi:hypothetical protein